MNSPLYRGAPFLRCMSHGLPGCYVCNPFPSTPLVVNSKPSGASEGADGQGVCLVKKSNLDFTGLRIVRRGNTVRQGALLGYVVRVRTGMACIDWVGGVKGHWESCKWLRVVAL